MGREREGEGGGEKGREREGGKEDKGTGREKGEKESQQRDPLK